MEGGAVTTASSASTGSASRWGPLWGARPADWALSEDRQLPTYEAALERTGLEPGQRVLDIGCGAGAFLQLVAERDGEPHGIDASDALIEFARGRLPDADLRVGEMEDLPWEHETFDLVTGFNSFFFANDLVAALREAGRVAKPGQPRRAPRSAPAPLIWPRRLACRARGRWPERATGAFPPALGLPGHSAGAACRHGRAACVRAKDEPPSSRSFAAPPRSVARRRRSGAAGSRGCRAAGWRSRARGRGPRLR